MEACQPQDEPRNLKLRTSRGVSGFLTALVCQVCLLALAAILPRAAVADGIVIPQTAFAVPQIPDQRALIHYASGVETLVIETSFVGPGTNFAWVVPLPAPPRIEPVSTGLFPTLQAVFQPEVVLKVKHYWIALPVAALVIWMGGVIRRSFFGALLLALCLLLIVPALLLPALSTASSKAGPSDSVAAGVRILNRQTVGLFDTATVQSADPTALLRWLNNHGFNAPTSSAPVIAAYVREGWVFAAARLNDPTAESRPRASHPLAFTFRTARPVYPLRLTATASASCRIDLYVFGPGRAEAPGFTVRRCEVPSYHPGDSGPRLSPGELRIRHRELATLIADGSVATKLTGVLDSAGMAHDAYVSFGNYWPSGKRLYTVGAALTVSANAAALLFMALFLTWWILSRVKELPAFRARDWKGWLAPVALAAGIVCFLGLPRAGESSYRVVRGHEGIVRFNLYYLAKVFGDGLGDINVVPQAITAAKTLSPAELEGLLRAATRDLQEHWWGGSGHPLTNYFTGEKIRFEASPGNVILRPAVRDGLLNGNRTTVTNGFELVWHDLDGAEALTDPVPPR